MIITAKQTTVIAEILREAAEREILPRFRNLGAGGVRQKTSALDVVTDADEAGEKAITAGLQRAFPSACVIGEEASEKDASLLDRLASVDLAFVVDPVDGTINFAGGLPLFGVMAAAIVKGEVAAGVILDPILGDWSTALRGEGAWNETAEGRRTDLKVAAPAPVAEMNGAVSWHLMPEPMRSLVTANLAKVAAGFVYRCAAHEYRLAAAGRCHFLVFHKLMPWDHAAGWLMHREAGGYAARFDGSSYLPTQREGGLICAPDRASWMALREALFGSRPCGGPEPSGSG
ncbi:MAG: inositol monophosphatase [Methylobacteriaceae bacterium]|nr:inositol monophosphatase [Methylobacteriaceae bacterium]